MSDYVLKEDSNSMADSSVEGNEVERKDSSSSFLLNQQKFEAENPQSSPRTAPPNSDHQAASGSKLDVAFEQIKVEESLKHSLKKPLTATSHSSSDQKPKGELNSNVDSVAYQNEIKAEKSVSSSSSKKVSAIVSALDPKKSHASPEVPRVQETVNQPFVHKTPPPVEQKPPPTEVVSARNPPEIPPPTEPVEVSARVLPPERPPHIEPMDVSARISPETPQEHENSENSASFDVKPTRKIPNYMAATASAKAKVRSLSIPKFVPEGQEKKRTPTSTNAKPPPFHETLRTPQRSQSQVRKNIHGNGDSIFPRDSTGETSTFLCKKFWNLIKSKDFPNNPVWFFAVELYIQILKVQFNTASHIAQSISALFVSFYALPGLHFSALFFFDGGHPQTSFRNPIRAHGA